MVCWKEYRLGVRHQILILTSCVNVGELYKLSGLSTASLVTRGLSEIMHAEHTAQRNPDRCYFHFYPF